MKKIILLTLLCIGILPAVEYQIVHLKKGGTLNVREVPVVTARTKVGGIPAYATGIKIHRCKYNRSGKEWCYVSYPLGGSHIEGWVRRYFLAPMNSSKGSKRHITNFLQNFYMADEENFLDKLQVFYTFPMQQYMYVKNLSLMQLRNRKVRFYKKWRYRDYRLTYMKILKRREDYIDVQTTVRWKLKNRKNEESGKDVQKVRIIPSEEGFKVLAIKTLSHTVFPKAEIPKEEDSNLTAIANNTLAPISVNATALKGDFYLQAGSFFKPINKKYLNNISNNGFPYIVQKVSNSKGGTVRRVLIGPFKSELLARQALPRVRSKISKNAYLKTLKN